MKQSFDDMQLDFRNGFYMRETVKKENISTKTLESSTGNIFLFRGLSKGF